MKRGRAGKSGSHRKGSTTGTGGHGKDKLKGRGPTPPAELRPGHPAARKAAAAAKRKGPPPPRRRTAPDEEVVTGRNAVVEALRAGVPAKSIVVATGIDHDDRVAEALKTAVAQGIPVRETSRHELDRLGDGAPHQGIAMVAAPYSYAHPDDVLDRALSAVEHALLVALDGVTDPRNLGAAVRSAAAFGAHGVVVPERRAAGVTAATWKASAGAVARLPVARATNLTRVLTAYSKAGITVVGLAADGEVSLDDLEVAVDPLCVVVGSEGKGLGRLVSEACDLLVRIPMPGGTESLNASVALAVTLAEVARRRRA